MHIICSSLPALLQFYPHPTILLYVVPSRCESRQIPLTTSQLQGLGHSCRQYQEDREFLSKIRELCANQSVWQLKTIKLLNFFFWFIFYPSFFHNFTTIFLISAPKPPSFQFELIVLETLFHSKKSTGRQLSPLPWLQRTKANCLWNSIVAVTGDSTEVPLKIKLKKNKTERTPFYLLCCVCSTTPASSQKERVYELHLESPKSWV